MRLLTLASQRVDRALLGAWYDPADAKVVEVLRQATVQQAHWMLDRGDETEAQSDLQSMSTGIRSFSKRPLRDGEQPQKLAASVADLLRTCGLFRFDPLVVG
ncbi:hypothetical protein ABXI76_05225 [Streptomyces parvus]